MLDFLTCYLGSMRTVSRDCRSSSQADVLRRAAARVQLQHKQEEDEWERTSPPDVRVIWGIPGPRQRMENEVRCTRNGNQIIEEIFPAPLYPAKVSVAASLNRRGSAWRKLCGSSESNVAEKREALKINVIAAGHLHAIFRIKR